MYSMNYYGYVSNDYLCHYGVKGMKWYQHVMAKVNRVKSAVGRKGRKSRRSIASNTANAIKSVGSNVVKQIKADPVSIVQAGTLAASAALVSALPGYTTGMLAFSTWVGNAALLSVRMTDINGNPTGTIGGMRWQRHLSGEYINESSKNK